MDLFTCAGNNSASTNLLLPNLNLNLQPQTERIHRYCKQITKVLDPVNCSRDLHLMDSLHVFQALYPDRFKELVKVHLSFIIDLPHFEEDSFVKLRKPSTLRSIIQIPGKKKNLRPKRYHISSSSSSSTSNSSTEVVSDRIETLINYLLHDSRYEVEGIFRKTGNCSRQKELRRNLLTSNSTDLHQFTVHDVANVLKTVIRDLDEPLLSDKLFSILMAIAELSSPRYNDQGDLCERTQADIQLIKSRQLKAVRILLLLIPPHNLTLLLRILNFLHIVAASPITKMTFSSLGMVFGPVLFCPQSLEASAFQKKIESLNEISAFLIKYSDQIKEIPRTFAEDVKKNLDKLSSLNNNLDESFSIIATPCTPRTPASSFFHVVNSNSNSTDDSLDTNVCFSERKRSLPQNYSEQQIAALCAHIRQLPDTKEKRRLEKRLNVCLCGAPTSEQQHPTRRHFCSSFRKKVHRCGLGSRPMESGIPSEDYLEDVPTPLTRFFNRDRRLVRALSSIRLYKLYTKPDKPTMKQTKLNFDTHDNHGSPVLKRPRRQLGHSSRSLPRLTISSPKLIFSDSAHSSPDSPQSIPSNSSSSTDSYKMSCSTIYESPVLDCARMMSYRETAL